MQHQHVARTWGPKGKPRKGSSGSLCYKHKNVDWTVHRLVPAAHEYGGVHTQATIKRGLGKLGPKSKIVKGDPKLGRKIGKRLDKVDSKLNYGKQPHSRLGKRAHKVANKGLDKAYGAHNVIAHGAGSVEFSHEAASHPTHFLTKTSPRWGEGKVPSRMEGRHIVPLPAKNKMQVSKKTYAAVGVTAVAAGGGYYYYRHRKNGQMTKVKNGHKGSTFHRAHAAISRHKF